MAPCQGPSPLANTSAEMVPLPEAAFTYPSTTSPTNREPSIHKLTYPMLSAYKMLGTILAGGDTVVNKTHMASALVQVNMLVG